MVQSEYDFITCLAKKREWGPATLFFYCAIQYYTQLQKIRRYYFYDFAVFVILCVQNLNNHRTNNTNKKRVSCGHSLFYAVIDLTSQPVVHSNSEHPVV